MKKMSSKNKTKTVVTLFAVVFGLIFLTQSSIGHLVSAKSGGADIYQQNCASCHGADGRAKTPKGIRKGATDLTKSTISIRNGIRVITNGREQMPDFKDNLSAAEINEVMNYISGFRKR